MRIFVCIIESNCQASSDDLLVPEEVLEVGDLQVGRNEHDHNGDDSEGDNAALDFRVLVLEALLREDE